ncbi:hypothetical protein ACFRAU_14430 [Arthrobacter sp. NPDC056691]|uniref:DUF7793 family protein n=1 Tax=Arthrobacter sp. NPDC056691 TaxID=3345913 RepID=UPI00366D9B60
MTIHPGSTLDEDDAEAARCAVRPFTRGRPVGFLLIVSGTTFIHPAAIRDDGTIVPAALAILGRTPVDKVLAYRLLRLQLPCPARYFTDEDDAAEWLEKQLAGRPDDPPSPME